MKRLVVGILAHVDAGKTTLSEAMLHLCGKIKTPGRVDHGSAFFDSHGLERERGITIFAKQAQLEVGDWLWTLLDTPGHVDFAGEMERTLQVLDYGILVINGSDGIQSHTLTLWRLLKRYRIPTFLFINKMDIVGTDRQALQKALVATLDQGCVDFGQRVEALAEEAALCDEAALAKYLAKGLLDDGDLAGLIKGRRLFPCFFGSALKVAGVEQLLQAMARYFSLPVYPQAFAARVYKIAWDPQGQRLTYMKITGGSLRVKATLAGGGNAEPWEEKVNQIRLYAGEGFQAVEEAVAGSVCAVTGLTHTFPGQGLGQEANGGPPLLGPVMTYQIILPAGCDPLRSLRQIKQLEQEDPLLHIVWQERRQEIEIQLMGQVQVEVLTRLIADRFGLAVEFRPGPMVYRETILQPVLGLGHFEPLRHYAEVHLLLAPGEAGSGLTFATACSTDVLAANWQRLVLTHLQEREHVGVLTGSPITDMKITLVLGKAHNAHTQGGDFRQATYRAVRQGLMQAESVLLEPWYEFRLEVPPECVGRAMADIQRCHGSCAPPEVNGSGGMAVLVGQAPVATMGEYARDVAAYTQGRGRFMSSLKGFLPCHNQAEVVAALGYDWRQDSRHPADSVFCAHGVGFVVPWDQVEGHMHLKSSRPAYGSGAAGGADNEAAGVEGGGQPGQPGQPVRPPRPPLTTGAVYVGSLAQDEELQAIFQRTYGPAKVRDFLPPKDLAQSTGAALPSDLPKAGTGAKARVAPPASPAEPLTEYLLVDGYNIIFAWDELKRIAKESIDTARQMLMDLLCNYQGLRQCEVILVFDAYRVPRNMGEVNKYYNIHVVFTKEAETADAYIEKTAYALARKYRVRVATSDYAQQLIIFGQGAERLSARLFHEEVMAVERQIAATLAEGERRGWSAKLGEVLANRAEDEKG